MSDKLSVVQRHFECIDEWDLGDRYKDWGLMVVPLTRELHDAVDLDAFLFTVKTMLPKDAKLVVLSGIAIRMSALGREFSMLFASEEWVRGPGGSNIPRLHPVQLSEAPRPTFWDQIIPKRIREYIKGVRCARSAGHSWRYSFYCGRAFRFLSTWRHTI
jgi:hypothetical protein